MGAKLASAICRYIRDRFDAAAAANLLLVCANTVGPAVFLLPMISGPNLGEPFWVPFAQIGSSIGLSSMLTPKWCFAFIGCASLGGLLAVIAAYCRGPLDPIAFLAVLFVTSGTAVLSSFGGWLVAQHANPNRRWLWAMFGANFATGVCVLCAAGLCAAGPVGAIRWRCNDGRACARGQALAQVAGACHLRWDVPGPMCARATAGRHSVTKAGAG